MFKMHTSLFLFFFFFFSSWRARPILGRRGSQEKTSAQRSPSYHPTSDVCNVQQSGSPVTTSKAQPTGTTRGPPWFPFDP